MKDNTGRTKRMDAHKERKRHSRGTNIELGFKHVFKEKSYEMPERKQTAFSHRIYRQI